jgi:hypothetical protein
MNITILHYHLNRGGVTRVIANHLLALDSITPAGETCRAAILFGGRDAGWPHDLSGRLKSVELSLHPLDLLDYQSRPVADPARLADRLKTVLSRLDFAPSETVLHIHNHSLGKNASLPEAITLLAEEGFGLLLQIHDFAEDFRPDNYRLVLQSLKTNDVTGGLYPQAPRIHYAVLNRRDHQILREAGVPQERLHFLPNTVPATDKPADRDESRRKLHERFGVSPTKRYVLYPVRGIRRKNIGEALVWSVLADVETVVGMTLAPLNPTAQTGYKRWKRFAADLAVPFLFETGEAGGLIFEENLAAADLMLTTSVAEGFGMVFLESWLAGRRLTGRNLPEVTVDFAEAGVRLPYLYDRLDVPIDWVDREPFLQTLCSELTKVLEVYGLSAPSSQDRDDMIARKIRDDCVDFGDLNELLQEQIIRRVISDSGARRKLLDLNPAIPLALGSDASGDVEHNRRMIQQAFSLEPSGRCLRDTYQNVLRAPASGQVSRLAAGERILSSFLDPVRFRLIRG